jgi:hypothetical protein
VGEQLTNVLTLEPQSTWEPETNLNDRALRLVYPLTNIWFGIEQYLGKPITA